MRGVKWALHDKKNPFFSPKNFEIQNLPLIHLPIYKPIFFQGHQTKIFFYSSDDHEKKIDLYIGK